MKSSKCSYNSNNLATVQSQKRAQSYVSRFTHMQSNNYPRFAGYCYELYLTTNLPHLTKRITRRAPK